MITIEQFRQMELKVATITQAEAHPNADRLLVLTVDVGGAAKQVVAGIRGQYEPSALIGKSVIVVDNLEPATIRGVQSQGMVLAASGADIMSVLTPDRPVPSGSPVR
ncbi:MAG: methionine--tRNA ligase subunit beta [Omnitrophica WOR_2 bacterium RIFCSPHIGHO2_02_FULL_68_15]|nr:MAG: methionine--tRNA ligase subunit beta [Omnitrophica WOR_2 bacterium RIFCSPHIGHO2_02_FULL_68_15]